MAIAKSKPPVMIDGTTAYVIEDRQLFAALVTATQHALAQYNDTEILAIRQDRLVRLLREAIRDSVRAMEFERFNRVNPRLFDRALRAYITIEVRKRQSLAFEEQLAAEYGPLEQLDSAALAEHYVVVNGIGVVEVEAPARSNKPKRA